MDVAVSFWAVFFLAACVGVWFAVFKLTKLLTKVEAALDPVAGKTQKVLESVDGALGTLTSKAEQMLNVSESTVKNVAAKVDTTSSLVEGAVAKPAIGVRSIMAGINRGLETWRDFEPVTHRNGTVVTVPSEEAAAIPGSAFTQADGDTRR